MFDFLTELPIIIIIIIIGGLVWCPLKNKNSRHYNVIKRSHKNSLNKNVFKSFLKCLLPIFPTPLSFGALAPWVPFGISRFMGMMGLSYSEDPMIVA